jgi:hypothetical protein
LEEENECKVKYCPKCNKIKSVNEFHKNKANNDGLTSYCGLCFSKTEKERKFRNWVTSLIKDARTRSRKIKNKQFDLTKEFILELYEKQNHKCYWYDIEMLPSLNSCDPQQPSIDRIDLDKGYTKDNIVLACFAANMGRNKTSKERFREFSEMLKGNINKND